MPMKRHNDGLRVPGTNVQAQPPHLTVPANDRKPGGCAYLHNPKENDPTLFWCNEPVVTGRSYCPHHAAICYVKPDKTKWGL